MTIEILETDLSLAKDKVATKKLARAKSKTTRKDLTLEQINTDFEPDDLEGIKKNRKLLELIVVNN
jgi:hypothetical protein